MTFTMFTRAESFGFSVDDANRYFAVKDPSFVYSALAAGVSSFPVPGGLHGQDWLQ